MIGRPSTCQVPSKLKNSYLFSRRIYSLGGEYRGQATRFGSREPEQSVAVSAIPPLSFSRRHCLRCNSVQCLRSETEATITRLNSPGLRPFVWTYRCYGIAGEDDINAPYAARLVIHVDVTRTIFTWQQHRPTNPVTYRLCRGEFKLKMLDWTTPQRWIEGKPPSSPSLDFARYGCDLPCR